MEVREEPDQSFVFGVDRLGESIGEVETFEDMETEGGEIEEVVVGLVELDLHLDIVHLEVGPFEGLSDGVTGLPTRV